MRSRALAIAMAVALAFHAALLLHGLSFVPEGARVVLAAIALLLVPGLALLGLLCATPPGGPVLSPAWALGAGVAWNAALLTATAILRTPFTPLCAITLPLKA